MASTRDRHRIIALTLNRCDCMQDNTWARDANVFMQDCEVKVTALLTDNQAKFHAFRELQRQGVQWPHGAKVRAQIVSAGFVYRTMLIKRDCCICETCLVEISGWRPWHNAWALHDYSRHHVRSMRIYVRYPRFARLIG